MALESSVASLPQEGIPAPAAWPRCVPPLELWAWGRAEELVALPWHCMEGSGTASQPWGASRQQWGGEAVLFLLPR